MDETREQLAREMDQRRKKLRLRWPQVAQRASLSIQTLLRIRKGEAAVSDFAAEGIEQALEWPPGYVEGILSGREPTPIQMDKPLTKRQQGLKLAYEADIRDHGPEAAFRMLIENIDLLNAERARQLQTDEHISAE
jgi:transcriptional regulator with XRE-family HTH domain